MERNDTKLNSVKKLHLMVHLKSLLTVHLLQLSINTNNKKINKSIFCLLIILPNKINIKAANSFFRQIPTSNKTFSLLEKKKAERVCAYVHNTQKQISSVHMEVTQFFNATLTQI